MRNISNQDVKEADALNVLREYEIYDLYFSRSLYESESVNSSEWNEIKDLMGQLGRVTGKLMIKLIKLGHRSAVALCVKAAKAIYNRTKNTGEATKYMFWALMMFTIGYTGNIIKDKYNENPIVPGTHVEYTEVDGRDTLIVQNAKGGSFMVQQSDISEAPSIIKITPEAEKKQKDNKLNGGSGDTDWSSPIMLLKPGQSKTSFYHASPQMIRALAEVEHFVDHIYDAKSGSTKQITKAQLLNHKVDATIGYGHKLTPKERQQWSFNKKVTKQEALQLYKKDLGEVERILNANLKKLSYDSKVEYSQGLIDGLTSLLYNMGAGNTYGNGKREMSELWKRLNNCRIDKKHNCINKSDVYFTISQARHQNITEPGHVYRREAECQIMQQIGKNVNGDLYHLVKRES